MHLYCGVRDGVAAISIRRWAAAVTLTVGKSCVRFCVAVEINPDGYMLP